MLALHVQPVISGGQRRAVVVGGTVYKRLCSRDTVIFFTPPQKTRGGNGSCYLHHTGIKQPGAKVWSSSKYGTSHLESIDIFHAFKMRSWHEWGADRGGVVADDLDKPN